MAENKNSANISINEKYLQGVEQIDIISVFGKKNLEEIQKIISDVTGLAFVTVDYKGEPVTEQTKFTRFCQKMRQDKERLPICKLSDASGAIIAATSKQTSIYFCPCGLLEVAIPIIVNDRYLGGFVGGQVLCDDAPPYVMRLSKNMSASGKDLEDVDILSQKYKEDLKDCAKYTYNEFVSISKLIELIISQLTKQELISGHNKMKNLNKIGELEDKIKELEYKNSLLKSKYDTILRYTNIFFVRNIFNMMSNLSIIEGATKTNDAILKYSNFITNELQNKNANTINEEIQRIDNLVAINKLRYENRIRYNIQCDESLMDIKIPFSVILPFVQASMYYSLTMKEADYSLDISIDNVENDIVIKMEDNGPGLSISELEKTYRLYGENHEGTPILKSVKDMKKSLTDMFGKEYKPVYEYEKDIGTKLTIKYPINFDEGINYV
ncbi:hypothetical protein HMPREF9628_01353 [Peptoanaerobacter stomatis]|uniref:PocR domain-containing protein n=1 Tax=Peptoanaerobacter stomatis TaxID=796937 RepID=G9XBI6_9FIRM|nr:PocR ligand-binding domain-containing protein [Peptoanaerobacter stomatis]EHL19664.1 hypothetical protein HMPREF9628_01353 [Peptoanaerobacter stomatis]